MKRKNVLNLLLMAFLAMGTVSCGSDNEGAPAPAPAPSTTVNNPITIQGQDTCQQASDFNQFKTFVNEGRFVKEGSDVETYFYVEQELERKDSKVLWIFDTTRYKWVVLGDFERIGRRNSDEVTHEAGNSRTAVRDYLVNILNNAVDVNGNGKYVQVQTSSGMLYGIDLCRPLAANPVMEYDLEENRGYFQYNTTTGNLNF